MMFSIIYFLKRRCDISAFSTEFLLWVVFWAQLQGGNSQGNRIKDANRFLTAVSGSPVLMLAHCPWSHKPNPHVQRPVLPSEVGQTHPPSHETRHSQFDTRCGALANGGGGPLGHLCQGFAPGRDGLHNDASAETEAMATAPHRGHAAKYHGHKARQRDGGDRAKRRR